MVEWETIRIPKALSKKLDTFLETDFAAEWGYTSKSQVVADGMRKFLATSRNFSFTLKHPKYGNLKYNKKGTLLFCAKHNKQDCKEIGILFQHKKLFDFDLLDDGDILSGIDFDKKPNMKN